MEFRKLGGSDLGVPVLSFGTATFGGGNEFFKQWGSTDVKEASRLVDVCLEHGVNFFDTANVYSSGMAEEILGQAIKGRRNKVIVATKSTFPMGPDKTDFGSSKQAISKNIEASLKRLNVDAIDLYYMHGFDAKTPIEETLRALEDAILAGKIKNIGASNFSGWHLMKSLSISEKNEWSKYLAHQVYYSLAGRDYESELMPLALDQNVSAVVWSPLAGGALSGKITRKNPPAAGSRSASMDFVVSAKSEALFDIVDVLTEIAHEVDHSVPQVALNWVLNRPSVGSLIVGARNEEQLVQNFGAVGWKLSAEQVARLDAVSAVKPAYPYWHQRQFPMLGH